MNAQQGRPRSALPVTNAKVAERIRNGETLTEIAESTGIDRLVLRERLADAGWSMETGHPIHERPTAPLSVGPFKCPPWVIDALCAETDPESFFPEKGGSTREAKAICAKCPVQVECLDFALDHGERYGIWGGVSERERRKLAPPAPLQPSLDDYQEPA